MLRQTEGSKYRDTYGMDIKEIAKLVRKDLKEAFPNYIFKVQIERYSMGQSLHIQVNGTGIKERFSEEARKLEEEIRALANEYNYDDSDIMTDYFNVRFYCNDIRVES